MKNMIEENLQLKRIENISKIIEASIKIQTEILWANIFSNTIQGSEWLKPMSLSPGRAALGYPALYALYRILNDVHPKSILEMGLGQSTKLISNYMNSIGNTDDYHHYVVEHNQSWIDYFTDTFDISKRTEIVYLPGIHEAMDIPLNNGKDVFHYDGFEQAFSDKKFDLILIDGPNGSEVYSRVDIIGILPSCLNQSFAIIIDDYERVGEQNTMCIVKHMLKEEGIAFCEGLYSGEKITGVLASEDWRYLCTL